MRIRSIAAAIAVALAFSHPLQAGESDLVLERTLGGALADPVVMGERAYLPTGRIITAVDYSDFLAPRITADTSDTPAGGYIVGLAWHGSHLYAAWDTYGNDSGVAVYSIADPDRPAFVREVRYHAAGFLNAHSIAASDTHLYLFDSENGLFVGDLSDPANPSFELVLTDFGSWQRSAVADGRLYGIGRNWSGQSVLDVFDLAVPTAPERLGAAVFDGFANFRLDLQAPLVFGFGLGFHVYDASDPASVTTLSSIDDGRVSFEGTVVGNMAYAVGNTDVRPWEVTHPSSDTLFANGFDIPGFEPVPMNSFATDVAVPFGTNALLATRADRVLFMDLAVPHLPRAASELQVSGTVAGYDIGFAGNRALILQNTYGLQVADAASLAPLARLDVDLPPVLQKRAFEQMHIDGNHAWITSWGFGLIGVDITDADAPTELGRWPMPYATAIDVEDGIAYVGRSSDGGGFFVVDVSDPSNPVSRGTLANVSALQLRVSDRYAFVADANADGGLRVIDVVKPDLPQAIAHYDQDCPTAIALELDVPAARAYLLCRIGALHVLDVSDPFRPRRLGVHPLETGTAVGAVAFDGNRVYVGTDMSLDEVDVSDPTAPQLVARHAMPSAPTAIRISPDGRVFVTTNVSGLHVFQRAPSGRPSASGKG